MQEAEVGGGLSVRERYEIPDTAVSDAENGFSFGYLDMPVFLKTVMSQHCINNPSGEKLWILPKRADPAH